MASHDTQPDLQLVNLMLLLAIRADALRDPIQVVYRWGLTKADAERLRGLSVAEVSSYAANLDQAVFAVRTDLLTFLNDPPAIAGALAAVRVPADSTENRDVGKRH